MITATTRLAGVIGSPIRHSRSPQLANAAFAAGGLDWTMVALEVAEGRSAGAVAAVRTLGLGGLMVTMPHKEAVIGALDRVTPAAADLGAVNSVAWEGDELVGDNTDGAGLVAALAADGVEVSATRCVVLGAGGAARAVARALGGAGAQVTVANRSTDRGRAAAALAGPDGRAVALADDDVVAAAVADAELLVNATSVGMGVDPGADGPLPVPAAVLHPGLAVVDLVYQPVVTPLLAAAAAVGARPVDGIGMLVHQAAVTIERWTGVAPDLAVMDAAARAPR